MAPESDERTLHYSRRLLVTFEFRLASLRLQLKVSRLNLFRFLFVVSGLHMVKSTKLRELKDNSRTCSRSSWANQFGNLVNSCQYKLFLNAGFILRGPSWWWTAAYIKLCFILLVPCELVEDSQWEQAKTLLYEIELLTAYPPRSEIIKVTTIKKRRFLRYVTQGNFKNGSQLCSWDEVLWICCFAQQLINIHSSDKTRHHQNQLGPQIFLKFQFIRRDLFSL